MYSRFDLVLPTGTQVRRRAPGVLELENGRVALTLDIQFGYGANLPRGFEEGFLGVERNTIQAFKVTISLVTKVKSAALLRVGGWKYYQWVDSFAARLGDFAEFARFVEKVGWDATMAHFRVGNNLRRLKAKQQSAEDGTKPRENVRTRNRNKANLMARRKTRQVGPGVFWRAGTSVPMSEEEEVLDVCYTASPIRFFDPCRPVSQKH